jgi:hypothetical protein
MNFTNHVIFENQQDNEDLSSDSEEQVISSNINKISAHKDP